MSKTLVLTPEGVKKLEEELNHLKKVRRPEIAERIKAAKEYGDLSENAEYHEAKEQQGFIEGRILEIEEMLKIAQVVDKNDASVVGVGSLVTVSSDNGEVDFHIVGATEADPGSGKISLDSPIGQALLEKKIGETAEIQTPNGVLTYTVKKIS